MIPLKLYEWLGGLLALLLLAFGLYGYGHHAGEVAVRSQWQDAITKDATEQAQRIHASDLVTTQVITQYIDRVHVVLTQGATITREVTRYVSPEMDRRYLVPVGFVRLLNAASSGQAVDARTPVPTDDAPSPLALSVVAASVSDNYTACRANAEQLGALQSWVRQQQALNP